MELSVHCFGYILEPRGIVRQAAVLFDGNGKLGEHLHANVKLLSFVLKRSEAGARAYSFEKHGRNGQVDGVKPASVPAIVALQRGDFCVSFGMRPLDLEDNLPILAAVRVTHQVNG